MTVCRYAQSPGVRGWSGLRRRRVRISSAARVQSREISRENLSRLGWHPIGGEPAPLGRRGDFP